MDLVYCHRKTDIEAELNDYWILDPQYLTEAVASICPEAVIQADKLIGDFVAERLMECSDLKAQNQYAAAKFDFLSLIVAKVSADKLSDINSPKERFSEAFYEGILNAPELAYIQKGYYHKLTDEDRHFVKARSDLSDRRFLYARERFWEMVKWALYQAYKGKLAGELNPKRGGAPSYQNPDPADYSADVDNAYFSDAADAYFDASGDDSHQGEGVKVGEPGPKDVDPRLEDIISQVLLDSNGIRTVLPAPTYYYYLREDVERRYSAPDRTVATARKKRNEEEEETPARKEYENPSSEREVATDPEIINEVAMDPADPRAPTSEEIEVFLDSIFFLHTFITAEAPPDSKTKLKNAWMMGGQLMFLLHFTYLQEGRMTVNLLTGQPKKCVTTKEDFAKIQASAKAFLMKPCADPDPKMELCEALLKVLKSLENSDDSPKDDYLYDLLYPSFSGNYIKSNLPNTRQSQLRSWQWKLVEPLNYWLETLPEKHPDRYEKLVAILEESEKYPEMVDSYLVSAAKDLIEKTKNADKVVLRIPGAASAENINALKRFFSMLTLCVRQRT